MYFKANIDIPEPEGSELNTPGRCIIEFYGASGDVFKYLSKGEQQKIAKDYNLTRIVNVNLKALKTVFPEQYQQMIQIKENFKDLPRTYILNKFFTTGSTPTAKV